MTTTYDVWFGESGGMTLRSEGQEGITWTIPAGELVYNMTYQWRIDSINEYGLTYGEVWEFTAVVFAPLTYSTREKLVYGEPGGPGDPEGDPSGEREYETIPSGENNLLTTRRLIAAAKNKIFYEDI